MKLSFAGTNIIEPSARADAAPPALRYVWAAAACFATTGVATLLLPYFDAANIVMLFLLTVVLVARHLGGRPAVLAAFLSVALFDYFCVPPRLSFAVADAQYVLTFAVMLAVALVIGQLTAGLRAQARVSTQREEQTLALYEFARDLSSLLQTDQVIATAADSLARTFRADVVLFVPDDEDRLAPHGPADVSSKVDPRIAQWLFDNAQDPRSGARPFRHDGFLYLPLRAPMRTRGVLALAPRGDRLPLSDDKRRHLDTFAALAAIALERVHYVEVAQQALLRVESERLRSSLLAALSHDLRTPLAALLGLADSLTLTKPPLSAPQLESTRAIVAEARRMSALVNNLLEMARIESGDVRLRREWQPFEEVVGSALQAVRSALGPRRVETALDPGLPLVEFDATLIERVLYNLLENAGKYTPPAATIRVAATIVGDELRVAVEDDGPGLPKGQEEAIFEKFTRGAHETATPGVGLGLAISRAIIGAHHGRIWAESATAGGARFVFTLPLGEPPAPPPEEA
jgi:two-component system sensor histidine kinase KdpD